MRPVEPAPEATSCVREFRAGTPTPGPVARTASSRGKHHHLIGPGDAVRHYWFVCGNPQYPFVTLNVRCALPNARYATPHIVRRWAHAVHIKGSPCPCMRAVQHAVASCQRDGGAIGTDERAHDACVTIATRGDRRRAWRPLGERPRAASDRRPFHLGAAPASPRWRRSRSRVAGHGCANDQLFRRMAMSTDAAAPRIVAAGTSTLRNHCPCRSTRISSPEWTVTRPCRGSVRFTKRSP